MSEISFERYGRRRVRVAVVGVAAVAAMVFAGGAWAHPYTATIAKTPAGTAGTGDTDTYTYTITNKYAAQKAKSVEITFPSPSWTVTPGSASATDGSGWGAPAVSGGKISVTATGSGLSYNQSLKIVFSGRTCTPGTSSWAPTVKNGSTVFSLTSPVPTVGVSQPGRLARFEWASAPAATQQAGLKITGTVNAKDGCGNLANYSGAGAVLSDNLGDAPNGSATHSYGIVWDPAGVGTVSAYAYKKDSARFISIDHPDTDPLSATFNVLPDTFILAFSPFSTQPGLAKVSTPIFSNPSTSAPMTVSAADKWGNVPDDGTPIAVALETNPPGAALTVDVPQPTTANGVATFSNLTVNKVANGYRLQASLGSVSTLSGFFNVVDDLAVCSGAGCSGSATTTFGQKAKTDVNAAGTLHGELLTSSFLTDGPPAGACEGFAPAPGSVWTEVKVEGGTPTSSKPSFLITLTIPGALLRNGPAWTFNVCLGTTPFEATDPWLTKTLDTSSLPWKRKPAVIAGGRYWGIVPSCAFANGEPLPWLPIPGTNPCVVSKKRTGFLGLTGDLEIVFKKPYPWDGRFAGG